jgi:hypothetical protein
LTTANGSGNFSVNLGYEPQWVLMKSTGSGRWSLFDNMRGVTASSGYTSSKRLQPQELDAENQFDSPYGLGVNATGFTGNLATFSNDFIYIAIRRGPMKVPTVGTSVFTPVKAYNATGTKNTTNFPVDLQIAKNFADGGQNNVNDRLRGVSSISTETNPSGPVLYTDATSAEVSAYRTFQWDNTGYKTPAQYSNYDFIYWNFRRAPSFFDEVCTTGNGSYGYQSHNLTVQPELYIQKRRNGTRAWVVATSAAGGKAGTLNTADALSTDTFISLYTTATQFIPYWDSSGETYVNYFFATCAGVSKVGSYTGTGALQTINCGFTSGARFVLIKRTDSTGDWWTYDSARGITSGNDPYLYLNSTAAEVTGTNYVDTDSTGFKVTAAAPAGLNASGGTYIFLAIA